MRKRFGFTIVELLTALVIIAILVGVLIPAMSMVRRIAKETAQKHQLTTIDMALMAFKNDYGDYPPSDWPLGSDYCGAQKLAEALVGWDLMGFHPNSEWTADGWDLSDAWPIYDSNDPLNLDQRRGPYLELATTNAFKLDDLFDGSSYTVPLDGQRFVICDVFGAKKIPIGGKMVKAGTPILYYKANTSSKTIDYFSFVYEDLIYNANDNLGLLGLGVMTDKTPPLRIPRHPLVDPTPDHLYYYDYEGGIRDPKVDIRWPYRPDSYILISAGADGLYGTSDDIRNF